MTSAAPSSRRAPDPQGLEAHIDRLELSTRARNCLRRAGIATLRDLVRCTAPDLLMIPAFGHGCLREVTRALDARHLSLRQEEQDAAATRRRSLGRPPLRGSLRQEEQDAAATVRSVTIEHPVLEEALDQLLDWARIVPERRPAVKARLGWDRDRPCSLQEVGDLIGVTRERVRQIQGRFERRVRGRVRMPALSRALDLLRTAAPTTAARAGQLLVDHGLAETPLHPAGLARVASVMGIDPGFEVVDLPGLGAVVLPGGMRSRLEVLKGLKKDVVKRARPFGFVHLALVREILAGALGAPEEGIAEIALIAAGGVPLDGDWYYVKTDSREPAVRLIEDMLAVAGGSLTAAEIAEGFARRLRWRASAGHNAQGGWFPSSEAILGLCRRKPDRFMVRGELVRAVSRLDWQERIAGVERTMIEVLMEAPGHVLHRDDFERRVRARGVNVNTFSVYTSYSPFLRDLGNGLWGIRGVKPDPVEVERLRRQPRLRRRQVEDWRWLPSGRLRVAVRMRRVGSLVVGMPAAIRRFVAGRTFRAALPDGRFLGHIKVNEDGTSWGYGRPLRAMRASPGDLMLADFDIESATVAIGVIPAQPGGGGAEHG